MKHFRSVFVVLVLTLSFVVVVSGCSEKESAPAPAEGADAGSSRYTYSGPPKSLYLQLVDGLHVTGEQVDVDIENYRLQVTGDVESPLNLSFQEIKDLDSVTKYIELNCPGFFTDRGDWTGVPVRTVLQQAQPLATVSEVEFISIDGGYVKIIPIDEVMEDRFLLAYEFEGKEFPPVHGYPLRLAAEGEEGNVWVKWLGEIRLHSK